MAEITLAPLTAADREQFILDNQEAFNYGALEEFGRRDDHFEEEGEIISRQVRRRARSSPGRSLRRPSTGAKPTAFWRTGSRWAAR